MENFDDPSFSKNNRVRVLYFGYIIWIQGLRWVTECEMNLTFSRFDTQVRTIYFHCKMSDCGWLPKPFWKDWVSDKQLIKLFVQTKSELDNSLARFHKLTQFWPNGVICPRGAWSIFVQETNHCPRPLSHYLISVFGDSSSARAELFLCPMEIQLLEDKLFSSRK